MAGFGDDLGFLPDERFNEAYRIDKRDRLIGAQIEDFETDGLRTRNRPTSDVVDIGEIACLRPVAEERQRAAFEDPLHEPERTGVRSPGRAVHREVPEDGDVQTVKVMVCVAKNLCRAFFDAAYGEIGLSVFASSRSGRSLLSP